MSARLVLPAPLRPLADGAREVQVSGATLREVLDDLATRLPILERRLRDETGQLRPHVLVFIDGAGIRGAGEMNTPVRDGAEVFVAPAVSGGWGYISGRPPRRGAGSRSRPGAHRRIRTR